VHRAGCHGSSVTGTSAYSAGSRRDADRCRASLAIISPARFRAYQNPSARKPSSSPIPRISLAIIDVALDDMRNGARGAPEGDRAGAACRHATNDHRPELEAEARKSALFYAHKPARTA